MLALSARVTVPLSLGGRHAHCVATTCCLRRCFVSHIKPIAEQSIAFVRRAGLVADICLPGHAQCRMPLAGNENHLGTMYAGAQFTLADITGGVLLLASFDPVRFYPILKDLRLEFLALATSDLTLSYQLPRDQLEQLQAQAEATGKAQFELHGELKDQHGVTVARAHGVFQARAKLSNA